jgi:uracil-DNA glycosylase family 4
VNDKQKQIEAIAAEIKTNNVCEELAEQATQLVMGEGNPDAEVVFIGEAPGAKEDQTGKPFMGAAGKFLNTMLESINLERADVYITNIVKYRPPKNRDPRPGEIKEFMPYLKRQIAIIQPKLIVFLGRHSMNVFLPELKISEAHGHPVHKDGQVYLPLYHPAAALYNGGMRKQLLEDFSVIPSLIKKSRTRN